MKNIMVLICCLMMHITVHCMELDKQEQMLIDDCKNQVKNCLEKYEMSNEFIPQDMENILGVLSFITNGSENSIDYIHQAKDNQCNGFFQYALKKIDLPITQWLIAKGNIKFHSEKEYADVIEFCTQRLSPTEVEKRETAYAILKSVIVHYKTNAEFLAKSREYYLSVMIMLQLRHRKFDTKFIIEEDLLIPFVEQNGLSDMYQIIVDVEDKENNTLAHIVVEQNDADELHKLMNKNYISKEVKNSAAKTVYDLAFDKFRAFTQNTTTSTVYPEKSKAARCCYYMLDKYFAGDSFDKKKNCCDKHPVLKRYGFDLLKQSPSVSLSPSTSSTSSSSSSELLVALKEKQEPVLEKSLGQPKIIADEPQTNGCCAQFISYIKNHEVIRF